MAGNLDDIGIGFGNAGGNRTDADLGNQFHRNLRLGMHLVQVMDQLGQIFDGINIVVGRRRYQGHPWFAIAQPGDVGIYLGSR